MEYIYIYIYNLALNKSAYTFENKTDSAKSVARIDVEYAALRNIKFAENQKLYISRRNAISCHTLIFESIDRAVHFNLLSALALREKH